MAFIPFPTGVVGAIFKFTSAGIPAQVTLGFKLNSGAATAVDGAALGAILTSWWSSDLSANLTATVTLDEVTVNDLTSSSGWQANVISGVSGSVSGTQVPNNVAIVVTLQTASRGRSFRGRNYLPGGSRNNQLNSTEWNSSIITAMDTSYNNMAGLIIAGGWTNVVLSRQHNGVVLSTGVATTIVNYRCNALMGTMRGRLT